MIRSPNAANNRSNPLPFPAFRRQVATVLEITPEELTPEADLFEDLGFDSVAFLELLVVVEDLGAYIPEETLPEILTFGHLHTAYIERFGLPPTEDFWTA